MRTVFLIFLSLTLLLAVGTQAAADDLGIIKGRVQTENGEVIPGVTVTLKSEEAMTLLKVAITNGNGEFIFNDLPTGEDLSLKFQLEGFQDRTVYEPLSPGQTLTLSVTLQVDPGPIKVGESADPTAQ